MNIYNTSFSNHRPRQKELYLQDFAKKHWRKSKDEYFMAYNEQALKEGKLTFSEIVNYWFEHQDDGLNYNKCFEWAEDLYYDKTIRGHKMEEAFIDWMWEEHSMALKDSSEELDRKYAVDCQTVDDQHYFQVKPDSYYYYNGKNKKVDKDKNQKFKELYGHDVVYVYYNEDDEFHFHKPKNA